MGPFAGKFRDDFFFVSKELNTCGLMITFD